MCEAEHSQRIGKRRNRVNRRASDSIQRDPARHNATPLKDPALCCKRIPLQACATLSPYRVMPTAATTSRLRTAHH